MRPVIGVLCVNEVASRPVQVVASRFIEPLSTISDATVLLVPAISDAADIGAIAGAIDGLLLTGSRSHVASRRYSTGNDYAANTLDEERDEVALALAGHMINIGKPVYGICRGLQEINVLFGGCLSSDRCAGRHHSGSWDAGYQSLFDLRHDVILTDGGALSTSTGARLLTVNSVHEQGVDRLGRGLTVEALASDDGLIEAVAARPCGGDILAVQWHPEWDFRSSPGSCAFFSLLGASLRDVAILGRSRSSAFPMSPRFATRGPLRSH